MGFHLFITPPSPAKEIEFVLEYDVSYVESALKSYHTEREARLRTGARSGVGVSVSVLPAFVRERETQGLERVGAVSQTARRVSVQPLFTRAVSAQASDILGAFALVTRRVKAAATVYSTARADEERWRQNRKRERGYAR
jgi:hypothetical protein